MKTRVAAVVVGCLLAGGCSAIEQRFVSPERLDQGLVIILPGIEQAGPSALAVREGLLQGGSDAALQIYYWGRPLPILGPLVNQVDVTGNRLAAQRVAQMILNYQELHPDRPVYLVGHSGGGGMAVFAAEALPPDRHVEGLVLLAASISKGYDLDKALSRCRRGVVNYYSKADVALLVVGTSLFGNVDGVRGPAAGAAGFSKTPARLYQVEWKPSMLAAGNDGGHFGATAPSFVARHVANWVRGNGWSVK